MKKSIPSLLLVPSLLALILTAGCQARNSGQNQTSSQAETTTQAESTTQTAAQAATQEETTAQAAAATEAAPAYVPYEDTYLSYEIPSSWAYDEANSDPSQMISLFAPIEKPIAQPSNVVVQIHTLDSEVPENVDFSNPELMQNFLEMVQSNVSFNMQNPVIKGYSLNDLYVYEISYQHAVGDRMIPQTAYFPQRFPYTKSIYATDFSDGVTPDIAEVAKHILQTLKKK